MLAVQEQDGGGKLQAKARGIDWVSLKQVFTDWHLYLYTTIYWSGSIPNYALTCESSCCSLIKRRVGERSFT